MKISPISTSFKGYVEVNCTQEKSVSFTPMTFNTNSIAFAPSVLKTGKTEIYHNNQIYTADCSYDTFQKACIKSEKSGVIENVTAPNLIDDSKTNID